MDMTAARDDLPMLAALGLLAYASADIAHHVIGHGGMCLALGGHIRLLTSVHVDCSVLGSVVDLAGPFANLVVGLLAWALAIRALGTWRLFLALAAGFNLLWFAMQLAFSAATRSDDFAWAMVAGHMSEPVRYALIGTGLMLYRLFVGLVARTFAPFGPLSRARRIVWTAWLTAGVFACVTALLDPHPLAAILHSAAPQSLALSAGLLFLPRCGTDAAAAPPIARSLPWLLAAVMVSTGSLLLLGPGFAV